MRFLKQWDKLCILGPSHERRKPWKYVSTKLEKPQEPTMEEWEEDIGKINPWLAHC